MRKAILKALTEIFKLPRAAVFLPEALSCIKKLINDKNPLIREKTFQFFASCLLHFELDYLKEFENDLILQLMAGLQDEQESVKVISITNLNQYAARRKKLFDKYKF